MKLTILIIAVLFSGVCFGRGMGNLKLSWPSGNDKPITHEVAINNNRPNNDVVYHYLNGNTDTVKRNVDSLDIKVISIKEFTNYLARIDNTIKKQFTIAEEARYKAIFKELQAIYEEADRKRKQK